MSSEHPATFPAVPPSLSAGDHEMGGYYTTKESLEPTPNAVQTITPYLGLRSRLSQIWINRWTVLLLLVLVRILVAIAGLNNDLNSAKTEAMSACSGVESMGSAMASMPHYLAAGVNELAASGVEKAVYGLMSMLLLTVNGVEELFIFYVHMLTQTYECLLTLVVEGSIHVAIQVIEDASNFLNSTIQGITKDISNTVSDFETDFNKFTSGLNSIPQAFGGKGNGPPTINVNDSLSKLNSIQLPDDLQQKLTTLNSSLPSFSTVENFTDTLFKAPFEEVKTLINGTIQNYTFDRSLLPVPQKEQLTFCSDSNGISDFFDELANIVQLARRVFIAVLIILAILACIPMAYQEIRRWRTMQKRAKLVGDKSLDALDVVYIASRPYTATTGINIAAHLKSLKRQVLTRWVIAYATSPPALLVLSLGITGLLSCLCQYILLKAVEKEVPALANEVSNFADKVVNSLDNSSATWASGTNNAILGVDNDINKHVFAWVNTTTSAINGTLNEFIDEATNIMNKTFGGTVLYQPVTGLFNCLIGLKVNSIEHGLNWVQNHAKVDFPLLPNDTFSLGATTSIADTSTSATGASTNASESFLASPGSEATDKVTNAVVKVTTHIADALHTEVIISTCIVLIWVIVFLLGLGRATYLCFCPEKVRGEGGPQPRPQRPFSSIIRGPAPAYEPPVRKEAPTVTMTPLPNFSEPMRAENVLRAESDDSGSAGEEWAGADEKTGHAGFRSPAREESPMGRGDLAGRRSVYPAVVNEKSDPFRD